MEFLFSCSTPYLTRLLCLPLSWTPTRREIRYLRASMYYSIYIGLSSTCAQKRLKTFAKVVSWQALNHCQQSIRLENVCNCCYRLFFFYAISAISQHDAPIHVHALIQAPTNLILRVPTIRWNSKKIPKPLKGFLKNHGQVFKWNL